MNDNSGMLFGVIVALGVCIITLAVLDMEICNTSTGQCYIGGEQAE